MVSLKEKIQELAISPVKREKIKKAEKERLRLQMRAALPVLTMEEIRRHRLPYHEALISELETTGHPGSAEFLRQLIAYQEMLRAEHGPDTLVWNRPQLFTSKNQMDTLFQGLSKAEDCNSKGNIGGECDEMMKLAVKYAFDSDDWWWLGEQLLIQCVSISSQYEDDGNRRQALSAYIYGKFFLENLKDPVTAQSLFNRAREFANGMPWTASKELNKKDEQTIFVQCCIFLYKSLMEEAEIVMKFDMERAIKLSVVARKRAAEACYYEGEANALIFKGRCERLLNNTAAAILSFQKALTVQLRHESPVGACEARVELALAYIRHGDTALALQQLQILMEYAKENNLPHYIAQAYRYLGMYHISSGEPAKATPLLVKAINLFHELNNLIEMEKVRNFAAISAAQELLPRYTKLIVQCDRRGVVNPVALNKLLRWKDTREFFWSEDDVSLETYASLSFESTSTVSDINVESQVDVEEEPGEDKEYLNPEESASVSGYGLVSKESKDSAPTETSNTVVTSENTPPEDPPQEDPQVPKILRSSGGSPVEDPQAPRILRSSGGSPAEDPQAPRILRSSGGSPAEDPPGGSPVEDPPQEDV